MAFDAIVIGTGLAANGKSVLCLNGVRSGGLRIPSA